MPKLKALSGNEVIKIFSHFDFKIIAPKGSHIKLRRILPNGLKQSLTIPLHKELDKGTLKAIYRQALRYISDEELELYFYE